MTGSLVIVDTTAAPTLYFVGHSSLFLCVRSLKYTDSYWRFSHIKHAIAQIKAENARFHALSQVDHCGALIKTNTLSSAFRDFFHTHSSLVSAQNSWFATTWQGGHVGGQNKRIFPRRIYMKIEFSSQRREMLLFLTPNMAAVTSRANQQFREISVIVYLTSRVYIFAVWAALQKVLLRTNFNCKKKIGCSFSSQGIVIVHRFLAAPV